MQMVSTERLLDFTDTLDALFVRLYSGLIDQYEQDLAQGDRATAQRNLLEGIEEAKAAIAEESRRISAEIAYPPH